jgi:hypothetical protein
MSALPPKADIAPCNYEYTPVSGVYRKPLENEGGKPLSFNGPFRQ